MKGIYICVGQDLTEKSSGIGKKIINQIQVLKNHGYEVEVINIDNSTSIFDKILFFIPNIHSLYQKRIINCVNGINLAEYNFIYIRKPVLSSAVIKLLKEIKKQNKNIKIIMEIPTYPIYGEYIGLRKILILPSMLTSITLKKYIDRIATYSDDERIWGVKTFNLSNCVNFNQIKPKCEIKSSNCINIIAVALFTYWHGYDRFIKGLDYYYSNGGQRNIKLFLVGDSNLINQYKQMVEKFNLMDRVVFCGKLYDEELDAIYNQSELGLDALGRHRSKVFYNSSLKGKEYGAKGLPIISGVKTELDSDSNYKYYLRVPADESPIDIDSIIDFYDSIYQVDTNKSTIIKEIRDYSKNRFDISNGFNDIIQYLK